MILSLQVRGFLDVLILMHHKLDNKLYVPEDSGVSSLIVVTPSCSQASILFIIIFFTDKQRQSILKKSNTFICMDTQSHSIFKEKKSIITFFLQEHIQNLTLFWDTKEEDDEEVVRLLKTLPGWDWTAPVYFRVHPVVIYTKVSCHLESLH